MNSSQLSTSVRHVTDTFCSVSSADPAINVLSNPILLASVDFLRLTFGEQRILFSAGVLAVPVLDRSFSHRVGLCLFF